MRAQPMAETALQAGLRPSQCSEKDLGGWRQIDRLLTVLSIKNRFVLYEIFINWPNFTFY